jgi:UDP-glucose 4-epimerase
VSVLEAIKVFEQSNNLNINYTIGPRRDGDIEKIYANNRLVKEKLGWEAKETLEQAMIDAWNWEKSKE